MWLIADYEAVTLFSLRLGLATSSGGKTLLVPTPYALKMALLDVACRTLGVDEAEQHWPELRDLRVALRPADSVVVTNLFQKVWKLWQFKGKAPEREAKTTEALLQGKYPFQPDIGYREYAQWVGPLGLALGWEGADRREWIADLMLNVSYLGKRGGFVQLLAPPAFAADLPSGFVEATRDLKQFTINGTLQVLDDCAPSLTFDKANVYSSEKVKSGKDRVARNIVLPYRLSRSSKSFSLYERTEG